MTAPDVEHTITLRLVVSDADAVPLAVRCQYRRSSPLAVSLVFASDGREVDWIFARELLSAGLEAPAGDGDVHVWPSAAGGVLFSLTSPDGQAVLQGSTAELRAFLADAYAVVPPGCERLEESLDAALAEILGTPRDIT
jgi:hypothetical protein